MISLLLKVAFGTGTGRAVLVGLGLLGAFNGGKLFQWWEAPQQECECPKNERPEKDIFLSVLEKLLKGL